MLAAQRKTIQQRLKEAEERGYKRGYARAIRRRQRLFNLLAVSNRHVYNIIQELDKKEPILGVNLSFEFAEKIIADLKDSKPHRKHAESLKILLEEAQYSKEIDQFLKEIQDVNSQ